MGSHFFKSFSIFFTFLSILIVFISCFFGSSISGGTIQQDTYYSFDLNTEYVWPAPRLYYY